MINETLCAMPSSKAYLRKVVSRTPGGLDHELGGFRVEQFHSPWVGYLKACFDFALSGSGIIFLQCLELAPEIFTSE